MGGWGQQAGGGQGMGAPADPEARTERAVGKRTLRADKAGLGHPQHVPTLLAVV